MGAAAALLALAPTAASAGKFKVLHSFGANEDGYQPTGPLLMDSAGNLFGVTRRRGKHSAGTIFEFQRTQQGGYKYKVIWNVGGPSGLIIDAAGNLYGLVSGELLKYSYVDFGKHSRWTLTQLPVSCPGGNCGKLPVDALVYAGQSSGTPYDGSSPLYGVTLDGGGQNQGAVFQLTLSNGAWTETVLHSFCSEGGAACTDGKFPQGGPLLDAAGNLYGTTLEGGGNTGNDEGGTIYQLSGSGNNWSFTTLYRFCSLKHCGDGAGPYGVLAEDAESNLVGTTAGGGRGCSRRSEGCGTVFRLTPNGEDSTETVLYSFCRKSDCSDGDAPTAGVLLGSDGAIFGTTAYGGGNDLDFLGFGAGVVFELNGSREQVLHAFCNGGSCGDGIQPVAR